MKARLTMDYATARQHMVESQIRTSRVTDERVIAAMADVPREIFLPAEAAGRAYIDDDVRVGAGRFLMEPAVLARLFQEAAIAPGDLCLVVGATTGYAAAILAEIGGAVVAVESDSALAGVARRNLSKLGKANAEIVIGPLSQGCPEKSPYQVIFLDGCVETIGDTILEQLAEEGRLVTVRRDGNGVARAILIRKTGGRLSTRTLFDANVAPLPGFQRPKTFAF